MSIFTDDRLTDKVRVDNQNVIKHGRGAGIMREIDIIEVLRQLGIEPARLHKWISTQVENKELESSALESPSNSVAADELIPRT
ncbi:hypothetical protein HQN90_05285 [Paenibacillus alba]|nr:hypothetical protein [Paenibacillus alba]